MIEAAGNCVAVSRVLTPYVARVVIANPLQVKAIAHAHVTTDKVDAATLASLHAAGYLPEIWTPDAATERMRRLVARRYQVVRHRTRIKNEVHAILHAHLIPKCPHADLFNRRGRDWLTRQPMPEDEQAAIARHVQELDRLAEDLATLDRAIAQDRAGRRGDPAPPDDHWRQSGGRRRTDGRDRQHQPLQVAAEAGELLRAEPARAPVRPGAGPSWQDKQGRTQSCPRHAGRGRLGCCESAGALAGFLHLDQSATRSSDRCGGRGAHPRPHRRRSHPSYIRFK
nr:transposase [Allgaiera indica]